MPRNRQHIAREKRVQEVLRAAVKVFGRYGYGGASMDDVAEAAGVTKAAVYWYYPSKDDAFAAAFRSLFERSAAKVERSAAAADPLRRLSLFLETMRPYRGLHAALHDREAHSAAVASVHGAWHAWLDEAIGEAIAERGLGAGEAALVADIATTLLEGSTAFTVARHASEMIAYVIERAAARPPGPARP